MMAQLAGLIDPIELFKALNGLSPLAVIGLLAYIIYQLVSSKKEDKVVAANLISVKDNHLSDMPEIVEILRGVQGSMVRIEASQQRMEVNQGENFAYLKARLNGKAR